MIPEQFFDLPAWIENFWIPLVLTVVIGMTTGIWKWWTGRRNARRTGDAAARLMVSREFSKVATQIGSLRMYDFGSDLCDNEVLAQKQEECLTTIRRTVYGPAAKVARNAGEATLSRLAVTATSMTVGNLELFVLAYQRAQRAYLEGHATKTPGERFDLAVWTRTHNFASRVLDPHRLTVLGYLRLALRSAKRVEDTMRVEGHRPKKAGLGVRLKWIFSM